MDHLKMQSSPLLALPAELRAEIWELALTQHEAVLIEENSKKHELHHITVTYLSQAQALTRTCKQIHNECGSMFYTCNDFELNLSLFFANVIVTKHFIATLRAAEDINEAPHHLVVALTEPPRPFDMRPAPDSGSGFAKVIYKWNLLNRLSQNLCRFQDRHPEMHVALRIPMQLDGSGEVMHVARIDFKNPEGSLEEASQAVFGLARERAVEDQFSLSISIALEKWRTEGFFMGAEDGQ